MMSDPAAGRFAVIQVVRAIGVAMVVVGLLTTAGRTPLPLVAGYVLIAAGLADAMLGPILLARRWRTPPE